MYVGDTVIDARCALCDWVFDMVQKVQNVQIIQKIR